MFRRCFSNELHLSFNFFLGASFQIFLSKELATSAIVLSAKMSDRKNDAKITRARSGPTRFSHHFLLHACANVLEQQAIRLYGDRKSCRVYRGKLTIALGRVVQSWVRITRG